MSDDTPIEPATTDRANETSSMDELPQWARDQLTAARQEAAGYRVKARDAKAEARTAAHAEYADKLAALEQEKADLAAERNVAQRELLKLKTALEAGIPGEYAAEFAELLRGKNPKELAAHAEKLKGLFHTAAPAAMPATDFSQGYGTTSTASPSDQFSAWVLGALKK